MKTLNFKKSSLHYKLASFNYVYPSENFCKYVRQVFVGVFKISLIFLLVFFMMVWPIICLGIIVIGGYHPEQIWPEFTPIGLGLSMLGLYITITIVILFLKGINILYDELQHRAQSEKEQIEKADSFVITWWKSFKDKVCFKINFIA
jgi:hypothetical protein